MCRCLKNLHKPPEVFSANQKSFNFNLIKLIENNLEKELKGFPRSKALPKNIRVYGNSGGWVHACGKKHGPGKEEVVVMVIMEEKREGSAEMMHTIKCSLDHLCSGAKNDH